MKNLKKYLLHTFHDTIPGIAEKIKNLKNMNQETGLKLLQYLMLCVLLYLCFLLPKTGAERKAKESAGQQEIREETTTEQSTDGQKDGGAQRGVIVIDAGHGGF